MRSDLGQRCDCYWAFATAVYSRTSDRTGMRRLWESLSKTIRIPGVRIYSSRSDGTGEYIITSGTPAVLLSIILTDIVLFQY